MLSGALVALGWLGLLLALGGPMEPAPLALMLGTIALAEAASAWAVAGWDDSLPRTNWPDAFERVLGRWIVLCVLFLGALHFGLMPFFASAPVAVLTGVGMMLGLALLKLAAACRLAMLGRGSLANGLRLPLIAAAAYGVTQLARPEADLVLSAALCIVLLLLTLELWSVRDLLRQPDLRSHRRLSAAEALLATAPMLLRHADLFVLPFLLPAREGMIYLVARGAAAPIPLALDLLLSRAAPAISAASKESNALGFVAAAARLNLGVLLVGGGVALGVLAAAPQLAAPLGIDGAALRTILVWLVLGQAAPVLFGAASLLMRVAGMRREAAMLCLFGTLGLGLSCMALPTSSALILAQHYAGVQVCVGLAGAALLAWRTGIWPGLTALLFRQIKLL